MKQKGTIFISAVIIASLMIFIAVSASNMLLQDAHMVRHLERSTKAQNVAEGGISIALATISANGFSAIGSDFPLSDDLGDGSYNVIATEVAGRTLLTSVGTVSGVTRTVAMEIKDTTATALYNMMSGANDLRLRAFFLGLADVNGDLHANHNVRLRAQALALITVDPHPPATCCNGDVSAVNKVYLSEGFLADIRIDGDVRDKDSASPPSLVTFPQFDYASYKQTAEDNNDYYNGDKDFGSIGTTTNLNPAGGIIYVDGTVKMYGTCNLSGGIVADRIRVIGRFNQIKAGTKNVIIAKGENNIVGDIEVFYRLDVEEAIVYAKRDFSVLSAGSFVNITGVLITSRNISIWNMLTYVVYNHKLLNPDGLLGAGGETEPLQVVSWNR